MMDKDRKVFFKVIIPAYNVEEYIEHCIVSIEEQSFKDFEIVVVDDMSSDNTRGVLRELKNKYHNLSVVELSEKKYNGGARNVGIDFDINGEYTLFVDADDWFDNEYVLEHIHDKIVSSGFPDCVSLSYSCLIGDNKSYVPLVRDSVEDLVSSLYVACWTKCVKSGKVVRFPENTLMEDVVQHIRQCDNVDSVVSIDDSCIVWNRNNMNSCSRVENQDTQNGKWQSSMYRYCADLMDMKCRKQCCEEHRKWRLSVVLENIKNGVYIQ